jgi:hypothetical protein
LVVGKVNITPNYRTRKGLKISGLAGCLKMLRCKARKF